MGNEPKAPKTSPVVHAVLISVQFCFSGWHIIGSVALVTPPLRFSSIPPLTESFA